MLKPFFTVIVSLLVLITTANTTIHHLPPIINHSHSVPNRLTRNHIPNNVYLPTSDPLIFILQLPTSDPPISPDAKATIVPGQDLQSLLNQAIELAANGAYEQAKEIAIQALKLSRQAGEKVGEGGLLVVLGYVAQKENDPQTALTYLQQALTIWRSTKNKLNEAITLNNLGAVYQSLGQYDKALEYFQLALKMDRFTAQRKLEGETLSNIGDLYIVRGDLTNALDNYQQALDLAQSEGDQHREMLVLNGIGLAYSKLGESQKALETYERTLELARAEGDEKLEATVLHNIATIYDKIGQSQKALEFYQQALSLSEKVGDKQGIERTLTNIGAAYQNLGQAQKALGYYQQALEQARKLGDREAEAACLNNIGSVYAALGDSQNAVTSYKQALEIARKLHDGRSEALTLANIGNAVTDPAKSLEYLQQALTLSRKTGDKENEARTLSNIGQLYFSIGEPQTALTYHEQALPIRRAIGDKNGEAVTLNFMGRVFDTLGNYQKSLELYQQALDIYVTTGNLSDQAVQLNNIGSVYGEVGQPEKALEYLKQALTLHQKTGDKSGQAAVLNNIGEIYRSNLNNPQEALTTFQQSSKILEEIQDKQGQSALLNNIGLAYSDLGNISDATSYYQQSLEIMDKIGDQQGQITVYFNLGKAYEAAGQTTNAMATYKTNITVIERLLINAALDSAVASLLKQVPYTASYQRLAILFAQQGNIDEAVHYVERGRNLLLRTELIDKPIDFRASADEALLLREQELYTKLVNAQTQLDNLRKSSDLDTQTKIPDAESIVDQATTEYQDHLETMQRQGGYLARQLAFHTAPLSQIQSVLPDDTTLIVYSVATISDTNSLALVISKDAAEAIMLKTDSSIIAEQVKTFSIDRIASADTVLSAIYDSVFAPLTASIKTKRIIIAADSALLNVPFAALIGADGKYLIDEFTISMIPSGTALTLLSARKPNGKATSPGLVLAQNSAPGLPDLRFAQSEATSIGNSLGVKPVLNATTDALRQSALGSRVIHIIAHAETNPIAPLFGTIYFAPSGSDDGRFEVRNVYEIDLTHGTELVVLSACNTAVGGAGEDFGVMVKAFLAAGTSRVVASLWSVDDQSTAFMMSTYISARTQGAADADALRAAMLATREKYPEPYYWASFVLTGLP